MTIEPMVTPRKPISSGSISVNRLAMAESTSGFVEVGDLSEHRIEGAGLFTDADHLSDHVCGNTSVAFSGSTKLSPRSTPARTFVIASSMITLPEVFAVMSSDCRIGTPEDSRVDSVRENLRPQSCERCRRESAP